MTQVTRDGSLPKGYTPMPKRVVAFALKHRIRLGREFVTGRPAKECRYYVLNHGGDEVESTRSREPTAEQAIAMMRRYLRHKGLKLVRSNPHKAGSADKAAAKELLLFIQNDGELYRQQTSAIQKNLSKKFKARKYSSTKAAKLWTYLADNGAKKYTWEYGDRRGHWQSAKGYGAFSAATRRLVGRLLEKAWHAEMRVGNFHD